MSDKMAARIRVRSDRRPNWFWLDNELIDKYAEAIGAQGIALYAVLCRHAKNDTGQTFIAFETLARILKCSERTVQRWLEVLVENRLVHVSKGAFGDGLKLFTICELPKVAKPRPASPSLFDHLPDTGVKTSDTGVVENDTGVKNSDTGVTRNKDEQDNNNTSDKTSRRASAPSESKLPIDDDPNEVTVQFLVDGIYNAYLAANGVPPNCNYGLLGKRAKTEIDNSRRAKWGKGEWQTCIRHYYDSDPERVNHGLAPEEVILKLKNFIAGPQLRFGGVRKDGHESKLTFEQQRQANLRTATEIARERIRARYGQGRNHSPDVELDAGSKTRGDVAGSDGHDGRGPDDVPADSDSSGSASMPDGVGRQIDAEINSGQDGRPDDSAASAGGS